MKYCNNITVRVFVKEEDSFDLIKDTFVDLFPFNLEKEKLKIQETNVQEPKMTILELHLEKDRHINQFLKEFIPEIRKEDFTPNEEFNVILKLDKSKLTEGLKTTIQNGECFYFKFNIACFPKNTNNCNKIIGEIFDKYLNSNQE